jgi:hypothetical protein
MFGSQLPAIAILLGAQSMCIREMSAEHFASPTAFKADDAIAMNGLSDRHRGCPGAGGFSYRFAETGNRLMNRRNQGGDLVSPDLITPNICGHNFRGEFSIGRCGRRLVRHRKLPVLPKHNRPSALPKYLKYWREVDFWPSPLIWPGMIHDCATSKSYQGFLLP